MAKPKTTGSKGDIWNIKAIDAQIDALKSSLNALKGVCATAQGSYCEPYGTCNTADNLAALASAQITVIENEITFLTSIKKLITSMAPNMSYFDT
jgi:hypothetical protein